MEEVPDMDDLLDEMESDLIRKSRLNHPPPPLPPTSIGMQPQAMFQKNSEPEKCITLSEFVHGEQMNEHTEGHINIDTSRLPNTFNLNTASWTMPMQTADTTSQSAVVINKPSPLVVNVANGSSKPAVSSLPPSDSEPEPESDPEPEPEDVSEVEEDTLIPETQIISNITVTVQDSEKLPIQIPQPSEPRQQPDEEKAELDTEMESMLEYLNGCEESTQESLNEIEAVRKRGGRESISESADSSVVSEYAEKLSEELMKFALLNPPKLHYDPAVQEFYETTDTTQEIFAMSLDETQSTENSDNRSENGVYLLEPEPKKERMPSVTEESEVAVEQEKGQDDITEEQNKKEVTTAKEDDVTVEETSEQEVPDVIKKPTEDEIAVEQVEEVNDIPTTGSPQNTSSSELETTAENSTELQIEEEASTDSTDETVDTVIENPPKSPITEPTSPESERVEEPEHSDEQEEVIEEATEEPVFDDVVSVAEVHENLQTTVAVAASDTEDSSLDTVDDDSESRPRFDSSIATVHVLHESDSDESGTVRRERRLTESELQLGKTSPYWIPDSECSNCMLCNAKFTLITRRHHCRACGRVLCGSCCSEKAVLEYLQEAGKKPQAVRVCKPCSSMLSRIEAHEQEERNRRESITSDVEADSEDIPAPSAIPRGVLKTRASTTGNEEDGASTSSHVAVSIAGTSADTSRRSVIFRDGVRPGAPADEENPEEERSTALKPKKKSRKRTAVVRRIAELKMEDELACALPKEGNTKFLVLKPESEQPKVEDASTILEALCNFSVVTIVLKKNLSCTVQIFNNPNFGLIWAVSSQGFAQIGLDELLFAWTLSSREKERLEAEEPELDETIALSFIPTPVLHRISMIYNQSTDYEFAGVRRVESRVSRVHSVMDPVHPLTRHIMLFRPTVQVGLENLRIPSNPFLIACFLHDDELNWATAIPNRLLNKLGEKYNVFPTPFVNAVGRPSLYTTDVSQTVLKVFTDFRSWSYRMRHLPGCTVSLTNDKTVIRIAKSTLGDLKEILSFNRSMVAWSCDLNHFDDSILICEETDPGFYSTQVFAKYIGQRESTSAAFVILDGGSKVNSLQVNVVEDGVAIRVQSDRLETILNAINDGHNVVETSKDMEFRVEFVEDGDWISADNDYYPKSQIDELYLMNKFQYGLSLERALTQVLQVQGISDYGVRMSHVYNLGDGRLQPEEEPKIYGMVEVAAKECVAMLEPHMQYLIRAGIGSVSIRLFVSQYEFEYEVSKWLGLEEENSKYKQSLDQLIPMLYNMIEYVPNGFEVEFVLSIVSTKALPNLPL